MNESYLIPLLGFQPNPNRYEQSVVVKNECHYLIKGLVRGGSRVLEIGCGTGSLLNYLVNSNGCSGDGIEPNANRALLASQKGLSVINSYLTEELDLPEKYYDYIIIADVLEHLVDPSFILINSKRFLKDGGSYIISVPNMVHWSIRLQILKGEINYTDTGILDATHLRWFTQKSLLKFLDRLGHRVTCVKCSNGIELSCYQKLPFFSRISEPRKEAILRLLVNMSPDLFACQFILVSETHH